ncbi:hypothetical protein B1R32_11620 [Abditibacterium utsteinense]|uniref:Uncharacterized protein n=1 Tax=Abditibacterium utsteinense TaxID=1960156 RepID=A0A2S8SQG8_9BACT|nr:hypothetical protein [Abditibacterium utsteinense]PQV63043.1 hypothetical protein B1R32_11620 [Abditibacterium utsteinense]
MKRKSAWLFLPLILLSLMLGAKWRADHPALTKNDAEMRALMSHSKGIEVSLVTWGAKEIKEHRVKLSGKEFQPFVDCFYLSPQTYDSHSSALGKKGIVTIKPREDGVAMIIVTLSLDKGVGEILVARAGKHRMLNIHPVTMKRWIEFLMTNPRIGPELRTRMKN